MKPQFDFPYPILRNDYSSSYNENCHFLISDLGDAKFVDGFFIIDIQISIICNNIKNLIEAKNCNVYLMYLSENIRGCEKIYNYNEVFFLKLPVDKLKSIDKIYINATIIAEKDFELNYHEEMNQLFNFGEPFLIFKKDILGESNKLEFIYNRTGDTIIQFNQVDEDDFKDFRVDLSGEDYIVIQISKSLNESYTSIKSNQKQKGTLSFVNSSIVHLAIVYVLANFSINGYENHLNKRWFSIMERAFSIKNISLKDELDIMNNCLDIDKIYEFTQIFINHYFEKSLELASKDGK